MKGAARGRHNHASLRLLNEKLIAAGLPLARSLTDAVKSGVRAKLRAPKPEPKAQVPVDEKKARYEAKRARREARRKQDVAAKAQREAENIALKE